MVLKDIEKLDISALKNMLLKEKKIEMLNKLTAAIIRYREIYGKLPKSVSLDYFDGLDISIDLFGNDLNNYAEILLHLFDKGIIQFDALKTKIISCGFPNFLYELVLAGHLDLDEFLKVLIDRENFSNAVDYALRNDGLSCNWELLEQNLLNASVREKVKNDFNDALCKILLEVPYNSFHLKIAETLVAREQNFYIAKIIEHFFSDQVNVIEIFPTRPDIKLLVKSIAAFFRRDADFQKANELVINFRQEVKEAIKSGQIVNIAFWDEVFPIDNWFMELINVWARVGNMTALETYGNYFSNKNRSYEDDGIKLDISYINFLNNLKSSLGARNRIRGSQDN